MPVGDARGNALGNARGNALGNGPVNAPSDAIAALLPAARAGDVDACERLVRELYPPVGRRLAAEFGRLGRHTVEDLTQEGMARVAARCGQCRARTDRELFAWAYRAARSAALNYLAAPRAGRDGAARLVGLDALSAWAAADPDAVDEVTYRAERGAERTTALAAERSVAPAAGPPGAPLEGSWRTVPRALLQRLAVDAYAELPASARELLWRHLVEGAGWEELGRDLRTPGPAVKRRFERACARLAHLVTARLVRPPESDAAPPESVRADGTARDPGRERETASPPAGDGPSVAA